MLENIALRHQLAVLQRTSRRSRFRKRDRIFWIFIYRYLKTWKNSLVIIKPETVIKWHRNGFRYYWRMKTKNGNDRRGRKGISHELRNLVLKMANTNPRWGAPRIHGELQILGIDISERTVSTIIKKRDPKPPSQSWKTFLKNHMHNSATIDFLTVQTVTFKILFVLVILSHDRRRVIHFNAT